MENLRVRRAGFAYRRLYDVFLERYKPLSKKTWPHWNGEAREGVMHILDACGLQSSDYQCGKTKIFIREPKKVMEVEGRYMRERHALATKIQAKFKAHQGRKNFLLMKSSVDLIARQWRKVAAMRYAERLKVALQVIKDFIVGWLHRNEPMNDKNRKFILYVRVSWLLQLRSCLPRNVLDHSWIQSTPTYLQETSALLRRLNLRTMVRKYVRGMSRARKTQMDEKLVASQMFRDKKASYPHSISEWFQSERLAAGPLDEHRVNSVVNKILESTPGARLKYITDGELLCLHPPHHAQVRGLLVCGFGGCLVGSAR
jgi:myosin-1